MNNTSSQVSVRLRNHIVNGVCAKCFKAGYETWSLMSAEGTLQRSKHSFNAAGNLVETDRANSIFDQEYLERLQDTRQNQVKEVNSLLDDHAGTKKGASSKRDKKKKKK